MSATDIITYVGIPLAVLGVLPILYSCIRAIITLRSIRHVLKHSGLLDAAIVRGNVLAGIVEVELPRCTIVPLDRDADPEYWKLNTHSVSLKGGSWTIFHWNRLVTGRQLYRCQFKDELRVPQADIDFEELVAFLLDRGAIPDVKGWHMLKNIGLWTPAGTALLRPPLGTPGTVLKVAPPDNSDGVLSVAVYWQSQWDRRNAASLPPFWMRLEEPKSAKYWNKDPGSHGDHLPDVEAAEKSHDEDKVQQISRQNTLVASSVGGSEPSATPGLLTVIQEMKAYISGDFPDSDGARFRTDGGHVEKVFFEHHGLLTGESRDMSSSGETASLWFVCAASSLSQNFASGLWNFSVPAHIVTFTKRPSIPCGIMVLLDILGEEETPPWSSPAPAFEPDAMARHRQYLESAQQRSLESKMPPAQAMEARRIRQMQELQQVHDHHMQSIKRRKEYEDRRLIEAINSSRLENRAVAEANLAYLIRHNMVPDGYTTEDLAHAVLYLLILDRAQAKVIAELLDRWMGWSQAGGINKPQLDFLKQNKVAFCYTSALIGLVEQANSSETSVSSDMLESMRLWKRVRLG
jgi:hypothetical protein